MSKSEHFSQPQKFYAKNSITGLFFGEGKWTLTAPTESFDKVTISFIKATWLNVVVIPLSVDEQAAEEGWSPAWLV
jgi:hypothetical protein